MWLWLIAAFGALTSAVALWLVRRLGRRLADLSQSYWELRYECARLRSQVARLDPEPQPERDAAVPGPSTTTLRQAQDRPASFVPLASLKSGAPER